MQEDIDELCRLEHLDPRRYQMRWVRFIRFSHLLTSAIECGFLLTEGAKCSVVFVSSAINRNSVVVHQRLLNAPSVGYPGGTSVPVRFARTI